MTNQAPTINLGFNSDKTIGLIKVQLLRKGFIFDEFQRAIIPEKVDRDLFLILKM